MTAFTIDSENNITAFGSLKEVERSADGTETLSSPEELTTLAEKWPGSRLVEIWNSLPGVEPVERFTSRRVAVTRIWKLTMTTAFAGFPASVRWNTPKPFRTKNGLGALPQNWAALRRKRAAVAFPGASGLRIPGSAPKG